MKLFFTLSLLASTVAPCLSARSLETLYFVADLKPIGDSGVEGKAIVANGSIRASSSSVLYFGSATGLEKNLDAAACTATNGCGAHIYSGTSCATEAEQGDHYYVNQPVDPWIDERYTTNTLGHSTFGGTARIGLEASEALIGRAFILHAADGTRVACGLLQPLGDYLTTEGLHVFKVQTSEISSSGVSGEALFFADDIMPEICMFGSARGLEEGIVSETRGGSDCTATDGCGTIIHSGTGCGAAERGGHYWNSGIRAADPWEDVGYPQTALIGDGLYAGCIPTGVLDPKDYDDKPFIIYSNDGSVVSCGILEIQETQNTGTGPGTQGSSSAVLGYSLATMAVSMIPVFVF